MLCFREEFMFDGSQQQFVPGVLCLQFCHSLTRVLLLPQIDTHNITGGFIIKKGDIYDYHVYQKNKILPS